MTLSAADITRTNENGDAVSNLNTRLVVRAIGYGNGNAVASLEATLAPVMLSGIVTNDSLAISGNPNISGTAGSVHSNQNLSVSGNPTVAGNATSSGSYSASGSLDVGGETGGGYANMTIPAVNASDYLGQADLSATVAQAAHSPFPRGDGDSNLRPLAGQGSSRCRSPAAGTAGIGSGSAIAS